MNVSDLKPYPKNAKKHDKKQIQRVAESIKRFGFIQPIVVDKNLEIVIGHCRYEAAKLLGMTDVPTISVDTLTEQEVMALRVADNKLNESDWDMNLALPDLKELSPELFDLTGFDRDLLIEPDEKDDLIPDDAPTRAKLGDIWALGRHRVMCGDSTDREAVARLMEGKKADMVFTDPPYGMDLNTDYSVMVGFGGKVGNKFEKVKGDGDDFTDSLIGTVLDSFSYCKEIFMFGGDYYVDLLPNHGKDGSWIVWDKQSNEDDIGVGVNDSYGKMFGSNFELCWSKTKHKRVLCRVLWKGMFGMGKGDEKKRIHPTQKPVEVGCWFMKHFSGEESLVADLFLGSGSTLIACEKTNRICYGAEIAESYVDVIIARWELFTGKTAKLIDAVDKNRLQDSV